MNLFGQIVRTVVNTRLLPVAVGKNLKLLCEGDDPKENAEQIERLKQEAMPDKEQP